MLPFNYIDALYRKDNKGNPCVWFAKAISPTWYDVYYGIIGKTIRKTTIVGKRNSNDAIKSEINEKRKKGYKYLNELKDNVSLPVEGGLLQYLIAYLPENRTTSDGSFLAMLAKTYDNENNKLFKNVNYYFGQWKINGLRCSARFYDDNAGLFPERKIDFQSREGVHWKSLDNLEEYLLNAVPKELQDILIENNWALDGEVYIPGHSVNEINHFVKDPTCYQNKYIQFWCYDIIADDINQKARFEILNIANKYLAGFNTKEEHLNNKERFVLLKLCTIYNDNDAIINRNNFIDLGFEGLIMRNPEAEYQFGKRNSSMIKYKKSTDGKFEIVDIKPEGIKRSNIPLFVCRNDINNAEFECHVGGSMEYQASILTHKNEYIGKFMYVEYGERSGVNQLPFHIKTTCIL